MEQLSEAELLRNIATGGRAGQRAIATLYDRYQARLIGYLERRFGLPRARAEEECQEIWVKVVSHARSALDHIDRGRNFDSWFFTVAKHHAIDVVSKQAREDDVLVRLDPEAAERSGAQQPAPVAPGIDPDADCIARALALCAERHPHYAHTLQLLYEGWDQQELAGLLGRTYGATREHVSQCRQRAKAIIRELCPGLGLD